MTNSNHRGIAALLFATLLFATRHRSPQRNALKPQEIKMKIHSFIRGNST